MELWELRKLPHLSSSSINDYCECGLLYKFGRIDRIPIEGKSDALEFGTVIHLVLAEYYEEKMIGYKLSIKEVHQIFEKHWTKHAEDNDDIQYTKDNDFNSILLMGKELLTIWHNKLPDDDFQVIGIEEAFSFHLPGIPTPLIGAMDLIEEDESGTVIITDFKTSARAYSKDEIDKNAQLTLYQLAAKANGFSDREILLRFDTLIKTKTPKFEQYWTSRDDIAEKRLIKKISQAWDGISKGVFIPNDSSWKCKNCFYRQACDEWFLEEAA
jgi:putative RecB family exonuclease